MYSTVVYGTAQCKCPLVETRSSVLYWRAAMTGAGGLPDDARERAAREADARLDHRGLDAQGRAARTRRLEEALVHTRPQDTHVLRRPPRALTSSSSSSHPHPIPILTVVLIVLCFVHKFLLLTPYSYKV